MNLPKWIVTVRSPFESQGEESVGGAAEQLVREGEDTEAMVVVLLDAY